MLNKATGLWAREHGQDSRATIYKLVAQPLLE